MPRVSREKRAEFRQFLDIVDDGSSVADDWTDSFYDIDSTFNNGHGIQDNLNIGLAVPNEISPDAPFIYIGGSSMGTPLMINKDDPSLLVVSFTSFWTIDDAKKIVADLVSAITDAEAMEAANPSH